MTTLSAHAEPRATNDAALPLGIARALGDPPRLRIVELLVSDRYRYWTSCRLRPDALLELATRLRGLATRAPSGIACRRPPDHPSQPATPARSHPAGGIQMGQGPPARPDQPPDLRRRHRVPRRGVPRRLFAGDDRRYVDESIDGLSGARVVDSIPLCVNRFAATAYARSPKPEGTS